MKSVMLMFVAAAALSFSAFTGAGCAGDRARENLVQPVLSGVGEDIREDVVAGIKLTEKPEDHARLIAELDSFIQKPSRLRMGEWSKYEAYANIAIDAQEASGEIGPGVADVLRRRLTEYRSTLQLAK